MSKLLPIIIIACFFTITLLFSIELQSGGTTPWTPVGLSGGGGMHTPAVSPHDSSLMLVNSDMGGVFRSSDGGETWKLLHWRQLSSHIRVAPVFHPTDQKTVFAVENRDGKQKLKISLDCGLTWKILTTSPPWDRLKCYALAVDSSNGNFLLVGTKDGAYATADGGKNWWKCNGLRGVVVGFHVDQTSPMNKRIVYAGTSDGFFRSDNGGKTWFTKNNGLNTSIFYRSKGVRRLKYSRAGFKYISFSGGSNVKSKSVVLYVTIPSRVENGEFVGGVYRSFDRGEHWESAMGDGINKDTKMAGKWGSGPVSQYSYVLTTKVDPNIVYVTNTSTGYYPPHHMTVYRSDNAGNSWESVYYSDPRFERFNVEHDYRTLSTSTNDQDPVRGLSINPNDPEMLILTNDAQIYITTNGGGKWSARHTKPAQKGTKRSKKTEWINTGLNVTSTWHYYVDPIDKKRHYIAYTDEGLLRSMDEGQSWTYGESGIPSKWRTNLYEIAFDPDIPGKMWGAFSGDHDRPMRRKYLEPDIKTRGGVVAVSTNYGKDWKPLPNGLPIKLPITSIIVDPTSPVHSRVLFAASFGKGIYKSINGGESWFQINKGLGFGVKTVNVYKLLLHKDGTVFCSIAGLYKNDKFKAPLSGGAAIYWSKDGGENWECLTLNIEARWINDFDVHPDNSRIVYFAARETGTKNSGLYKTVNEGKTWELIAREGPEHFGVSIHPAKTDWVFMTLAEDNPGDTLWLSKDGGKSWKPISSYPFHAPTRVQFNPHEKNKIYVTSFGAGVLKGFVDLP